jgi:hypothetical protein
VSGIGGWLKSNILIVIFAVLIIGLPIGGYFGSSIWNKKIKTQAEEKLTSKKRQVDGVARVTYTLPPITADEQPFQEAGAPNAAMTEFFARQRAERQAIIEDVVTQAVRFNKKDSRDLLLPGVLPVAGEGRDVKRKVTELAELIVGEDELESAYEPLFRELNAGKPMPQAEVARRVVDAYRSEVDRAGGDLGTLSEDERAALDERMKGQRYGVYARRAEELSVYGSKDVLYGADPVKYSAVPSEVPGGSLDETDALRWQMDYWLVEDLLRAIDLANRDGDGLRTEVPRSPVKRIVSIRLGQIDIPEKGDDDDAGSAGAQAPTNPFGPRTPMPRGPGGAGGAGGSDVDATHTGRKADDKNGVYLLRSATVTVIASSADLVGVLESFGSANFMTVTDVELSEVDRWADLAEGYFYGEDHVVRAEITVEAAYLHFWLADILPDHVASAWGVAKPDAVQETPVP